MVAHSLIMLCAFAGAATIASGEASAESRSDIVAENVRLAVIMSALPYAHPQVVVNTASGCDRFRLSAHEKLKRHRVPLMLADSGAAVASSSALLSSGEAEAAIVGGDTRRGPQPEIHVTESGRLAGVWRPG